MKSLSFPRPTADLSRTQYDLIVVGGGITGAGIAQDAASRGLKVALVEKGDFASGTSSKSTKLIHGGLRYLENLQFKVVLESVRERQLQQQIAPHMVTTLPFIIATYRGQRLKNMKLRLGLTLYDSMAMGTGTAHQRHHTISHDEVLRLCPGIDPRGLTGGIVYLDCRTDDARHTLEVIKSACMHGAVALNYTKVVALIHDAANMVSGVEVVDTLADDGSEPAKVRLYGRVVVNATGVWTQKVTSLASGGSNTEVVPAKGIHITISPERLPLKSALIVPSAHDKRFCFAIPWYDSIVVGTTDTEYAGDLERVVVEPHEKRYILDALNLRFPGANFSERDITGEYAGLRPLIKAKGAASTADISREYHLELSPQGLISMAGGKLTTYRRMARAAVDMVVNQLCPEQDGQGAGPCITDTLMLGGWDSDDEVEATMAIHGKMALDLGLGPDTAAYLPTVYGRRVPEVLMLARSDARLAKKLSPHHPYIAAQVTYALLVEGARTLDDVLARRMRLTITDYRAALAVAERVADIMAAHLRWTETAKAAQLETFRKEWLPCTTR